MRQLAMIALLSLLLAGCGSGKSAAERPTDSGLCDGLSKPIDDLNDAVLIDGGPLSIVAADAVITGFDGGCLNGEMD